MSNKVHDHKKIREKVRETICREGFIENISFESGVEQRWSDA